MKEFQVLIFDANGDTVYKTKLFTEDDDYHMGLLRAKTERLCEMLLGHDFSIEDEWTYDG